MGNRSLQSATSYFLRPLSNTLTSQSFGPRVFHEWYLRIERKISAKQ